MTNRAVWKIRKGVALFCAVLLPLSLGFAQGLPPQAPPDQGQQQAPLPPEQLDNLVAPVALYPDPLLGEVLAASTYPLEAVEAQQWLKQNTNLRGPQLIDAAKQMNWDPSVQALVAFPEALNLLANDVQWTTELGNAFLAQQTDVMNAVQHMRALARANGKLANTAQQVVTTQDQDGQSAIEIQPADPQVVYVPVYQPQYVWGAPAWGAYPDLWYPPYLGAGFGWGWGPGIYIGSFFPGWGGWGGWGWGLGWYGHSVYVNTAFFGHYGFHGAYGGVGYGAGHVAWAHDASHRMGVPYPNRAVATRFNSTRFNSGPSNAGRFNGAGSSRFNAANNTRSQFSGGRTASGNNAAAAQSRGSNAGGWRTFNGNNSNGSGTRGGINNAPAAAQSRGSNAGGWRTFNGNNGNTSGTRGAATNGFAAAPRQASPNRSAGAPSQSFRSAPSFRGAPSTSRSFAPQSSAPRAQNFSAPRQSFSAPSAPRQSFSAPAPRSFSGGGGGGSRPSFSGGGHSSGGGGGGHHR